MGISGNDKEVTYSFTDRDGNKRTITSRPNVNIGTRELENLGVIKRENNYAVGDIPFCSPLADLYRRLDERDAGLRKDICGID